MDPHPLDLLLPIDPRFFDWSLVLVLPAIYPAERREEAGTPKLSRWQRPTDSAFQDSAQQQELEISTVRLPTNSFWLALHSAKLRDLIAHDTGEKELVVQCRSEGEVAGYRHLLALIHTHCKEVPQSADDLIQLLLLAREHAVDAAVFSCLQRLQQLVNTLPATTCFALIAALDMPVSSHHELQEAADRLKANGFNKLCRLVATGSYVAKTGWLLDRLGQEQRARLRSATLCMARVVAAVEGATWLPTDLSQRILVMSLVDA